MNNQLEIFQALAHKKTVVNKATGMKYYFRDAQLVDSGGSYIPQFSTIFVGDWEVVSEPKDFEKDNPTPVAARTTPSFVLGKVMQEVDGMLKVDSTLPKNEAEFVGLCSYLSKLENRIITLEVNP